MTRLAIFLAALALLPLSPAPLLPAAPAATPVITPPKEHFGFNIGDDYCLANYKQLQSYWEKLAKESDRIKVVNIGKTEEGRDQLMAIVTSPANHKKLDRYRNIARRLAKADGISPEQAKQLADEGKAVVWIDGGLHASEILCAQVLIETVYQMLSANDPETLRILDDVIILFVHCNPDGMDLCADWYMREKDPKKRSLGGLPRALREVRRPRQQSRFLRRQPGRDAEHEQRHVPRVVPADRLQPPPDRARRHGHVHPAVPRSVQLQHPSDGDQRHRARQRGDGRAVSRRREAGRHGPHRGRLFDLVQRRAFDGLPIPQHDRPLHRNDRRADAVRIFR